MSVTKRVATASLARREFSKAIESRKTSSTGTSEVGRFSITTIRVQQKICMPG